MAEKIKINYDEINNLIAKINNNFYKTFMDDEITKLQSSDSDGEISSVNINAMISNIEFIIADVQQEEGDDSGNGQILEEIRTIFLQTIQSEMDELNKTFDEQGKNFDEIDNQKTALDELIADNNIQLKEVEEKSPENILEQSNIAASKEVVNHSVPLQVASPEIKENSQISKEQTQILSNISPEEINKLNESILQLQKLNTEQNEKILNSINNNPEELNKIIKKIDENTEKNDTTIAKLNELINKNNLEVTEIVKSQVLEAITEGKVETKMSEKTEKLLKYSNVITIFSFLMIICFLVFGLQIYSDHTKYQNLMKVINSLSIEQQKTIKDIISNEYNN